MDTSGTKPKIEKSDRQENTGSKKSKKKPEGAAAKRGKLFSNKADGSNPDAEEKSTEAKADKAEQDKGKNKKGGDMHFVVRIFFMSMALSGTLSFLSNEVLNQANLLIAFCVLLFFIVLGIVFDIIGVAVTAADERPFHSMATHRIPGAREAINLIRKADKVSSFCNDVVGDICGIVSGTTAAIIVLHIQETIHFQSVLISLGITALVSGLTIGGKAIGKTFAIEKSTSVLHLVGKFLHLFSRKKR